MPSPWWLPRTPTRARTGSATLPSGTQLEDPRGPRVVALQRIDAHGNPGIGGVDHVPVAHVDADMVDRVAVEDEIARLELVSRDMCAVVVLVGGRDEAD